MKERRNDIRQKSYHNAQRECKELNLSERKYQTIVTRAIELLYNNSDGLLAVVSKTEIRNEFLITAHKSEGELEAACTVTLKGESGSKVIYDDVKIISN